MFYKWTVQQADYWNREQKFLYAHVQFISVMYVVVIMFFTKVKQNVCNNLSQIVVRKYFLQKIHEICCNYYFLKQNLYDGMFTPNANWSHYRISIEQMFNILMFSMCIKVSVNFLNIINSHLNAHLIHILCPCERTISVYFFIKIQEYLTQLLKFYVSLALGLTKTQEQNIYVKLSNNMWTK